MSIVPNYGDDGGRVDRRFKPLAKRRYGSWRVGQMWDIHHKIARLVSLGEKNKDIAEKLQISREMVSHVRNSKLVKDKVDIMVAAMDAETIDLGIRIREFAPKALSFLEKLVQGEDECKDASLALRARYADRHMDRAGYTPVRKLAVATGRLTPDDIENIKKRARESAREAGIVEAEFSVVEGGRE